MHGRRQQWYSPPLIPPPPLQQFPLPPPPPPVEDIPQPPSSRSHVKCILLSISIFLLLVLTTTAVALLFNNLEPASKHNDVIAELGSFAPSNVHILYFRFQTGTELQLLERHPELGTLDGLNLTNVLDYSVCCNTVSHQFVCLGGNSLTHGGALEAFLQEQNDEVFLLLWLNSRDLIEVGCIMRATVTVE